MASVELKKIFPNKKVPRVQTNQQFLIKIPTMVKTLGHVAKPTNCGNLSEPVNSVHLGSSFIWIRSISHISAWVLFQYSIRGKKK